MEVTPQTLREVEFREKLRGYHPDDVDEFLEKVAAGIEMLQRRLKEATERAGRAEHQLGAAGELDDSVRRTLVLAQRTADLAIKEAREEAAKLVAHAEARARDVVAEAEERSRRTTEEAQTQLRADLERLETARRQLQGDVGKLEAFLAEERERLRGSVGNVLKVIDTALSPPTGAPSTKAVDVPPVGAPRSQPAPEPARSQPQFRPDPPPDNLASQFPPDPAAPQSPSGPTPRPATAPQPHPQVQPQQQPLRQPQASGPPPVARSEPQPAPPRSGPPQAPPPPRPPASAAPPPRTGEPVPPPAPPRTMSTAPRQPSPVPTSAPPAAVDLERDDDRDDAFFAELRRAITDDDPEPGNGTDVPEDDRRRLRGRRRR